MVFLLLLLLMYSIFSGTQAETKKQLTKSKENATSWKSKTERKDKKIKKLNKMIASQQDITNLYRDAYLKESLITEELEEDIKSTQAKLDVINKWANKTISSNNIPEPKTTKSNSSEWNTCIASTYGIGDGLVGQKVARKIEGFSSKLTKDEMTFAARPGYLIDFGQQIEVEFNGKRCTGTRNDSGPSVGGRKIDLGPAMTRTLGFSGVQVIKWRFVQ